MAENVIQRHDIGAQQSARRNEAMFPNVIREISPTFGLEPVPIYVYNVSPLGWEARDGISRPPNHPHLTIKACPPDKRFVQTGMLQHPFAQVDYDANQNRRVDYTDGYREATVMLSPMNPGIDQNWDVNDPINIGGNLNNYGVFWSKTYPPSEEELAAAKARMEKTFRAELAYMAEEERKDPQNCGAKATRIAHVAAEYYGQSTSWHRSDLRPKEAGKIPCEVCAEMIQIAAQICVHCGAPTASEKQKKWLEAKFKGVAV